MTGVQHPPGEPVRIADGDDAAAKSPPPGIRVLLVQDDPARGLAAMLAGEPGGFFVVEHAWNIDRACARLMHETFDVVLLSIRWPDQRGLEELRRIRASAKREAIVVISGDDDPEHGLAILREGAQDHLFTGRMDRHVLSRAIRHSIEREQKIRKLEALEERLRQTYEHGAQLFYSHTVDDRLLYVSPQASVFFDVDPAEALQPWTAYLTDNPVNALGIEATRRAVETGQQQPPYQLELKTRLGRILWVEVQESPVVVDGKTTMIVGALSDITARKIQDSSRETEEVRFHGQRNALVSLARATGRTREGLTAQLQQVTEAAARTLGVERVSVWRYNPDHSAIECLELYELSADRHSAGGILLAAESPGYFRALAAQEVIAAHDAIQDQRSCEFSEGYLRRLGITSMLDAPFHVSGLAVGVLCHEHIGPPRRWTADEETFAIAMANVASLAFERSGRVRAEQELLESTARYRTLVEHAPVAVFVNRDDRIVLANAACLRLFGATSPEQLLGKSPFEVFHPEDHDAIRQRMAAARNHATVMPPVEERIIRLDGTVADVEVTSAPFIDQGSQAMHVVLHDITERKRFEEAVHLRSAALDAAANPIMIADRAGTVIWANPAFSSTTGYSAFEAIGKNPRELLRSGRQDPVFYKRMWDTILSGNVWRGELVNRRKDGSLYPENMTITPVRREGGEITHFIAVKRDLTEEKALQSQFLQAQKMETVGRLAGGVAHDFNNLLTVINGIVELSLTDLRPEDPLHADLEEVRQAGQRAAALTTQLLAFSRQQVMQPARLDLNVVVTNLLRMLRRLIGEDIELHLRLADSVPPILADSGQLEQVLVNLSVNARDAMPGGGTLSFETGTVELNGDHAANLRGLPPGRYVRLSVRDTGVGMEEATRARIFEPFFTTKGAGKGTGLGLSTVFGIVTQSGGAILVESAPGSGTEFIMYFPVSAAAALACPSAPRAPLLGSGTEVILLVDDESALRSVTGRLLRKCGYRVLTAATGREALQLLEQEGGAVDLVLTDVVMPGMSGPGLAEGIRRDYPAVKVVFTSGYTADSALQTEVRNDTVQFLAKPYSLADLTRKVREVLDGKRH